VGVADVPSRVAVSRHWCSYCSPFRWRRRCSARRRPTTLPPSRDAEFGSADQRIVLRVADPKTLQADLTALEATFGAIDVIGHQEIAVPGSVETLDLRTQDPSGPMAPPCWR